jgi:predicted GTPase
MRKVIVMGNGGREFHSFCLAYRFDPLVHVVAFTSRSGGDHGTYPSSLAGPRYPDGIEILPEEELSVLIRSRDVDEVVLAYSELSHDEVMHRASIVLAAGADFRLLGPDSTMIESARPVVAVTAARTGSGKSQTSRAVARALVEAGLRVALIHHPTEDYDLGEAGGRRFASREDVEATHPTLHDREEYERAVAMGLVVYTGVDTCEIVKRAEKEADVIIWDGAENDFPLVRPDLHLVVLDPCRVGHELRYHPGETNLRMADAVIINKIDSADADSVERLIKNVTDANPNATIVRAESRVELEDGMPLPGHRVLVVEDGHTVTQGGMPFGAGTVAAQNAGALRRVDPRHQAVGSIADAFARYPNLGHILPAMGQSPEQLAELEATINAVDCDVVVAGTSFELRRLIRSRHPVRQVTFELSELGEPTIAQLLSPIIKKIAPRHTALGDRSLTR